MPQKKKRNTKKKKTKVQALPAALLPVKKRYMITSLEGLPTHSQGNVMMYEDHKTLETLYIKTQRDYNKLRADFSWRDAKKHEPKKDPNTLLLLKWSDGSRTAGWYTEQGHFQKESGAMDFHDVPDVTHWMFFPL